MGERQAKVARSRAAEHEARTGMIANMQPLGWRPGKRSKVDGTPLEFTKNFPKFSKPDIYFRIGRGVDGKWYVARMHRVVMQQFYRPEKLGDGITFSGPVAAAMWLRVELSNGNYS